MNFRDKWRWGQAVVAVLGVLGAGIGVLSGAGQPLHQREVVPPDFAVTLEDGATHAEWGRCRTSLDASGRMVVEETRGMRLQKERREWLVSSEEILTVARAVERSGFMHLQESYADPRIMDGWSAWIRVKMEGREHGVSVRNTHVAGFDLVESAMKELVRKTAPKPSGETEKTTGEKP